MGEERGRGTDGDGAARHARRVRSGLGSPTASPLGLGEHGFRPASERGERWCWPAVGVIW
jgi:hypothetical protein